MVTFSAPLNVQVSGWRLGLSHPPPPPRTAGQSQGLRKRCFCFPQHEGSSRLRLFIVALVGGRPPLAVSTPGLSRVLRSSRCGATSSHCVWGGLHGWPVLSQPRASLLNGTRLNHPHPTPPRPTPNGKLRNRQAFPKTVRSSGLFSC